MSDYANYVDPTEITDGVAVGVGSDRLTGRELVALYANGGELLLDAEMVGELIIALVRSLEVLGGAA